MVKAKEERGDFMVGLGLALAVMLLIVTMSMSIFSSTSKAQALQAAESQLLHVQSKTRSVFQNSDFSDLDTSVALKNGVFFPDMVRGSEVVNAFGGKVELGKGATSSEMKITFTKVPPESCGQFTMAQGSWSGVEVNGSEVETNSVASVTDACSQDDNTVAFKSY